MPPNNKTAKSLSGPEFRVWRLSRGFSLLTAGDLLGVSPQAVRKAEEKGLSRKDALALAAIDAKLDPYEVTERDMIAAVIFDEYGVLYDKATPAQIRDAKKTLKLATSP